MNSAIPLPVLIAIVAMDFVAAGVVFWIFHRRGNTQKGLMLAGAIMVSGLTMAAVLGTMRGKQP